MKQLSVKVWAAVAAAVLTLSGCGTATQESPAPVAAQPGTPTPTQTPSPSPPATVPVTATQPATPAATPTSTTPAGDARGATTKAPATSQPPATSSAPKPKPVEGEALAAAKRLTVKGRAPKTGYDREAQYGTAWIDVTGAGCDTRNQILNRDLTQVTHKPGTRGCVVTSGVLADPYSGKTIHFTRGQDTSRAVQIDHVVALMDSWQSGAQSWDRAKRIVFANDPLNLLAVDGDLNAQKGAANAASWLPPNKAFRCEYVARQVAVKKKYELWVTGPEQEAMIRVLSTCPEQKLPTDNSVLKAPRNANETPAPAPKPSQPSAGSGGGGGGGLDPQFSSCKKAKAAGYGPYYRGSDPEYDWYKDGDGDGIVCE